MRGMNLFLSEEDIQALSMVDFDAELVNTIRAKLDAHHEKLYKQQTEEFLASQYSKLMMASTSGEKSKILWEVISWKENYKSPYTRTT